MKVEFEGRTFDVDLEHLSYQLAMGIQSYTGMSISDWQDSLAFEADKDGELKNPPMEWLKSLGALYWLMRQQNGDKVAFDELDFDFQGFLAAYVTTLFTEVQARKAEARARAAEPDPTQPDRLPLPSPESPTSATPPTMTPQQYPAPVEVPAPTVS